MAEPFIGEIRIFAGTFAPQGWNFCDGTLLSISSNDTLYSLIGNTYGGDGQNTFALPDLRGRVPIHRQNGPYPVGQSGGAETVTILPTQIPQHTHAFAAASGEATGAAPAGQFLSGSADFALFGKSPPPSVAMDASSILPAAGWNGTPHDNMQPFQCINYIIALVGIYPSQS